MKILLLLTGLSVYAQSPIQNQLNNLKDNSSREDLKKFYLGDFEEKDHDQKSPGISFTTPTGYASSWRQYFAGVGFVDRGRYGTKFDGGIGAGLGFGNPYKSIGGSVFVGYGSILTDPFSSGSLSLSIGRVIKNTWSVSIGVNDLVSWGDNKIEPSSVYLATSNIFRLKKNEGFLSYLALTLGAGNGYFLKEENVLKNKGISVFGSLGVPLFSSLNWVSSWNGQNLDSGLSYALTKNITVNGGLLDILDTPGDGIRYLFSIGFGSSF